MATDSLSCAYLTQIKFTHFICEKCKQVFYYLVRTSMLGRYTHT